MSDLIRSWVTDQLAIKLPSDASLEQCARDGKLLVKVMTNLGLFPSPIADEGTPIGPAPCTARQQMDARFVSLQTAMKTLGVDYSPIVVKQLISGAPRAAVNLLHQIKLQYDQSQLKTSALQNGSSPPTHARGIPVYDRSERRHLTHIVRQFEPGQRDLFLSKEKQLKDKLLAEGGYKPQRQLQKEQELQQFRLIQLAEMDESIRLKDYSNEWSSRQTTYLKKVLSETRTSESLATAHLSALVSQRKMSSLTRTAHSVQQSLQQFEQRLQEINIDGEKALLPDVEIDIKVAQTKIDLKRKTAQQAERHDSYRQQRLAKFIVDQSLERCHDEETQATLLQAEIIGMKSNSEIDLENQVENTIHFGKLAFERGKHRTNELSLISDRMERQALYRDGQHFELELGLHRERLVEESERLIDIRNSRLANVHLSITEQCGSIVQSLINVVIDRYYYRTLTLASNPPEFLQQEWQFRRLRSANDFDFVDHCLSSLVDGSSYPFIGLNQENESGQEAIGSIIDHITQQHLGPWKNPDLIDRYSPILVHIVSIIGPKWSGKSSLAAHIRDAWTDTIKWHIVDLDCVMKESGRALQPDLIEISDELGVQLFLEHIDRLKSIHDSSQADRSETRTMFGVILDGFPWNFAQASLFERQLSGRTIPEPVNEHNCPSRLIKYPINVPFKEQAPYPSGIRTVFRLHVSANVCTSRGFGVRYDQTTKEQFHLDHSLPPFDQLGKEDLKAPADISLDYVQNELDAWDVQSVKFDEWFAQFDNIYHIDAEKFDVVSCTDQAIQHLSRLINAVNKRSTVLTGPAETPDVRLSEPSDVGPRFLDVAAAEILHLRWIHIEQEYINGTKARIQAEIESRSFLLEIFQSIQLDYLVYLERSDPQQTIVEQFRERFNLIDQVFRLEPQVKAELHERLGELVINLSKVIEQKQGDNRDQLTQLFKDDWFSMTCEGVLRFAASLLQLELTRHVLTESLIEDYLTSLGARPTQHTLQYHAQEHQLPVVTSRQLPSADAAPPVVANVKAGSKAAAVPVIPADIVPARLDKETGAPQFDDQIFLDELNRLAEFCRTKVDKDPSSDEEVMVARRITVNRFKRIGAHIAVVLDHVMDRCNRLMRKVAIDSQLRNERERHSIRQIAALISECIENESAMLSAVRLNNGVVWTMDPIDEHLNTAEQVDEGSSATFAAIGRLIAVAGQGPARLDGDEWDQLLDKFMMSILIGGGTPPADLAAMLKDHQHGTIDWRRHLQRWAVRNETPSQIPSIDQLTDQIRALEPDQCDRTIFMQIEALSIWSAPYRSLMFDLFSKEYRLDADAFLIAQAYALHQFAGSWVGEALGTMAHKASTLSPQRLQHFIDDMVQEEKLPAQFKPSLALALSQPDPGAADAPIAIAQVLSSPIMKAAIECDQIKPWFDLHQ